jgi:predicted acetyltransferase
VEIRPVTREQAADAYDVTVSALMLPSFTPATRAERMAAWDSGLSWGAFEADRIVGHARCLDLETTVPGGARLPTAGVTSVGVLATHTRRGALRAMMEALLADARRRGLLLASLRASQAPLYGRYGFGLAGLCADHEIAAGSRLRPPSSAGGHRLDLLPRGGLRRAVPEIHQRVGTHHVGAVGRLASWDDRSYGPLDDPQREHQRWIVVAVDEHDRPSGYADYCLPEGAAGEPTLRRIEVTDLFAANDESYRALWRYLLDIDLVGTVVARRRPVDERLRWMLEDARALRTTAVLDEQWVRLLDVEQALCGRSYAPVGTSVVLEVDDPMFPENGGRYRVGPDKALRTDDPPDLRLDVADCAAIYLGGVRAADLVAVGRVVQCRAGAAAATDALFAVHPAPWCGTFF